MPPIAAVVAAVACCVLAACGAAGDGDRLAGPVAVTTTSRPPRPALPAARRWVAVGTTNSYVGPSRTVVALAGEAPRAQRGDRLVSVTAERAHPLFEVVRGARRVPAPVQPTGCADCGTTYAQADGAYFRTTPSVLRELERLGVVPPG